MKKANKTKKIRILFAISLFLYIAVEVVLVHIVGWKFLENPMTTASPAILLMFSYLVEWKEKKSENTEKNDNSNEK